MLADPGADSGISMLRSGSLGACILDAFLEVSLLDRFDGEVEVRYTVVTEGEI